VSEKPEVYVFDTCAVTEVRRRERTIYPKVFTGLGELVDGDILIYPPQVMDELERYYNPEKEDPCYDWVKKHHKRATRHGKMYNEIKGLLDGRPQLQKVIDVEKAQEEADLHVLALAHHLRATHTPVVVTEDRRTRPQKLSLADACGVMRIVTISLNPFLDDRRLL
jgi:hypothetical protein